MRRTWTAIWIASAVNCANHSQTMHCHVRCWSIAFASTTLRRSSLHPRNSIWWKVLHTHGSVYGCWPVWWCCCAAYWPPIFASPKWNMMNSVAVVWMLLSMRTMRAMWNSSMMLMYDIIHEETSTMLRHTSYTSAAEYNLLQQQQKNPNLILDRRSNSTYSRCIYRLWAHKI